MCREVLRLETRALSIEELSNICREVSIAKGSRWIEEAIEQPESILMDRVAIEKLLRM